MQWQEPSSHLRAIALALVLLTAAILYICNFGSGFVGFYHDDGIYVVTAKALATGQGYKLISLPNPIPQTKYPIFYPFLLSLIWRVFPSFPENILPMKLLSVVSAILFFILCYCFFIRSNLVSKIRALGIVAMAALCSRTVYFSSMVMSEMLFALLSVLALMLLETYKDQHAKVWSIGMPLALLIAAACMTRTIGVSLFLAAVFYLFYRRQIAKACLLVIVVLALVSPWFIWAEIVHKGLSASKVDLYYANYSSWLVEYINGSNAYKLLNVPLKNLIYLIIDVSTLINPLITHQPQWVKDLAVPPALSVTLLSGLLLMFLGFFGVLKRMRYRFTALDFYLMAYLGLMLVWPWPPWRFVVVIIPFLFMYVLKGVAYFFSLVSKLFAKTQREALTSMAMVMLVSLSVILNLALDVVTVRETMKYGWSAPPPTPNPGPAWKDIQKLYQAVGLRTPSQANIATINDLICYLYGHRQAVSYFMLNPIETFYVPRSYSRDISTGPTEILRSFRANKIDYLVSFPGFELLSIRGHINFLRTKYPGLLSLIHRTDTGNMLIYKVDLAALDQAEVLK